MNANTPSIKNINSIYRDKQKPYKCLLYFYRFVYVITGLHFGFFQFKPFNSKIVSVLLILTSSINFCAMLIYILIFYNYGLLGIWWFHMEVVLYFICTIFLACTKNELTFCCLYNDLQIIDSGLKANHAEYYLEVKLILSISVCYIIRLSSILLYCLNVSTCTFNLITIAYIWMLCSADIILTNCTFMFYAINCRLKKLTSLILTENSNFMAKQYLYKAIVDIAEQHVNAIAPVFLILVMIKTPQVMIMIYATVFEITHKTIVFNAIAAQYSTAFLIILTTLMPAIYAGMLSTQAINIKIILHNKLLELKDAAQAARVERFIRYVEARGCRWRIAAVLPLDARLLSTVLSFCVTYLIVIVQFTYNT